MKIYDVVVVGGGPAGLVATRYCLHAHLSTAIVSPNLGGKTHYPFQLRDAPRPNTVWGANLIEQFEEQIAGDTDITHIAQHATLVARHDDGTFRIEISNSEPIQARAVIVATGATPQRLYVAGEKEYWGRGVSFSAISHAPYFAGRDVAVIGGGRRTLVAALELAHIARRIYLIAAQPQSMADLPEAARVREQENVTLFTGWEVQEITGDEYVTGITLVGSNGETRQLSVEGVFVEMALLPDNELVRGLVDLDPDGHIIVNHRCETNVPGLFAAGDVTNIQSEQVLVAMGEGAKAALSAWEYLATQKN